MLVRSGSESNYLSHGMLVRSGSESNYLSHGYSIIAYSMGQIIKPVCRVSVCVHSNKNTLAFLDGFSQKLAQT